jgi:Grx4 family monothiol glutaredoxin
MEERIKALLASAPLLLFMKGAKDAPYCGFSSRVVDALKATGHDFATIDIFSDEAVRQGLKEYSNWPTYPQLYLKGELVGGCDIVTEMAASGELKQLLDEQLGGGGTGAAAAVPAAAAAPAAAAPAAAAAAAPKQQQAAAVEGLTPELSARLEGLVRSSPVVLFMKGAPDAPRCGFSRKVVEALRGAGLEFGSFDILTVREGFGWGLKWGWGVSLGDCMLVYGAAMCVNSLMFCVQKLRCRAHHTRCLLTHPAQTQTKNRTRPCARG